MARDRTLDAFALVDADLRAAVAETLRRASPEPAREVIDRFLGIDDGLDPDVEGARPGETMAMITVGSWLARSQLQAAVDTDLVLAWIGEHLGNRCRLRAGLLRGFLDGDIGEAMSYADALDADYLPAMIWLAAGVVACHGEGDASWLPDERS